PRSPLFPYTTLFRSTPFHSGHVLMITVDRLESLADAIQTHGAEPSGELTPGINLVGFAFGEFGLGENLRALANACASDGIPFAVDRKSTRLNSSHVS